MTKDEQAKLNKLAEVIARLDERSLNTWRSVEDMKHLLEKQNGRIRKNTIAIAFVIGSLGITGGVYGLIQIL